VKWLSFFVFGLGSLVLTIVVFPLMRIVLHPRQRFSKYARRVISFSLAGFVGFMHVMGIVNLETENRKTFRRLSSKIIVANHPSLLDVVMLFSLFPNADCIVQGYLNNSILMGIVRQLYILSSLDFNDILNNCSESLKQGNCLIIFPEGTRTPRHGKIIVKKGAARIALASGCGIIPIHIGGTDKYGLGKKDPWTGFNPRERYVYRIDMKNEIYPEQYRSLSVPAGVRAITKDITAILFPEKN
jgi:1-acyl-sn-glycerol-3-phosphate acyltransferase